MRLREHVLASLMRTPPSHQNLRFLFQATQPNHLSKGVCENARLRLQRSWPQRSGPPLGSIIPHANWTHGSVACSQLKRVAKRGGQAKLSFAAGLFSLTLCSVFFGEAGNTFCCCVTTSSKRFRVSPLVLTLYIDLFCGDMAAYFDQACMHGL